MGLRRTWVSSKTRFKYSGSGRDSGMKIFLEAPSRSPEVPRPGRSRLEHTLPSPQLTLLIAWASREGKTKAGNVWLDDRGVAGGAGLPSLPGRAARGRRK